MLAADAQANQAAGGRRVADFGAHSSLLRDGHVQFCYFTCMILGMG
jgi:hypothetical protein